MARGGMRATLAVLAGLALPVGAAGAAEVTVTEDGPLRITITPLDCSRIDQGIAYRQPPGVEYQPGVDARGRAVAPADVGGGYNIDLPEEISFYLSLDLAERLQERVPEAARGAIKAETVLGAVTIYQGQAYWNGEPMEPSVQRELREACRTLEAQRQAARQRSMQR
ncbi:hypothetical protein SAMN05421508_103375 [Caenispirillum bisanense]|uniref:Uncharacterized protein n=1 Tax=Caenispirillum bisanense TaxID=414052 RepID=A0A286GF39_9PROT|nr:hypothetical protein SAMN05421508_103375 [Caenispirillum bisanense]